MEGIDRTQCAFYAHPGKAAELIQVAFNLDPDKTAGIANTILRTLKKPYKDPWRGIEIGWEIVWLHLPT